VFQCFGDPQNDVKPHQQAPHPPIDRHRPAGQRSRGLKTFSRWGPYGRLRCWFGSAVTLEALPFVVRCRISQVGFCFDEGCWPASLGSAACFRELGGGFALRLGSLLVAEHRSVRSAGELQNLPGRRCRSRWGRIVTGCSRGAAPNLKLRSLMISYCRSAGEIPPAGESRELSTNPLEIHLGGWLHSGSP